MAKKVVLTLTLTEARVVLSAVKRDASRRDPIADVVHSHKTRGAVARKVERAYLAFVKEDR